MGASTEQNLEINAGDAVVLQVTFKDAAAAAIDITGKSITWKLAREPGATVLVSKSVGSGIAITDGPGGVAEVTLDTADTTSLLGVYRHQGRLDGDNLVTETGTLAVLSTL